MNKHYASVGDLVKRASRGKTTISRIALKDQSAVLEVPEEAILSRMGKALDVMRSSSENGMKKDIRSTSGLTGGDGYRMKRYASSGKSLSGDFCGKALSIALGVAEYNASMGKIVAAPTAGSCGILPAAILTMMDERGVSRESAILGLLTAGAVGMVIANVASISGAEGGCQAECGSAAAMAAAALVELSGGSPAMAGHACAIAIKNQLGLVCDPVAGLVEVPCIKRNAGGIMCAVSAADMALAGITSVIPVDEVIGAMREVGDAMPCSLRETAQGGLAATPTGVALRQRVLN